MAKIKITERTIAALPPPTTRPQEAYWDDELTGFGVVLGRAGASFVAQSRVKGKKRRTVIGRHGAIREDGTPWNVARARKRARELLGSMSAGVDPNNRRRSNGGGITLRQALDLHVADMKKRGCSPRSVETIESEIPNYAGLWLDTPLVDIEALDLHELHESMTTEGKRYLANRVIAEVSAVWNTADRLHDLGIRNPASRVRRNKLAPKRERIDDSDLASWRAKVDALPPIRRDLQLFVAFTGLRSADARSIRWDDVDLDRKLLRRPAPKGGESKAFELPLPKTCIAILKRRKTDNATMFAAHGGDAGLVFPTVSRNKPYHIVSVPQPKEDGLPGLHVLRRTFISVASDVGVPEIDRHVLANHSFSDRRVQDGYVKQSWARLVEAQAAIEAALIKRMTPTKPANRKGRA